MERATPVGRRTQGFTLVELLIVVMIIGVLVGLLVPATVGALQRATTLECANNLRQMALAIRLYAADHDDRFPPSSCAAAGAAREDWWLNALQRYTETDLLYRCPGDPVPESEFLDWENPPDESDWLRYRWASYCMNGRMDKATPHQTAVRSPSRTILVCEAAPTATGSDHVHPELWLSAQDVRNAVDHSRHGGRSNFLFVDGHVETLSIEETWAPHKVNLWNPRRAPEWCTPMEY
jgi:prepilin-type processing-associated H-X9-DG protein/prepilin-type N-terminal cleavage/methylation domain-containing protein